MVIPCCNMACNMARNKLHNRGDQSSDSVADTFLTLQQGLQQGLKHALQHRSESPYCSVDIASRLRPGGVSRGATGLNREHAAQPHPFHFFSLTLKPFRPCGVCRHSLGRVPSSVSLKIFSCFIDPLSVSLSSCAND